MLRPRSSATTRPPTRFSTSMTRGSARPGRPCRSWPRRSRSSERARCGWSPGRSSRCGSLLSVPSSPSRRSPMPPAPPGAIVARPSGRARGCARTWHVRWLRATAGSANDGGVSTPTSRGSWDRRSRSGVPIAIAETPWSSAGGASRARCASPAERAIRARASCAAARQYSRMRRSRCRWRAGSPSSGHRW